MNPPPISPPNRLFRAVIVCGGLFAITVMSMVASTFGDPEAPPNRFFHDYGIILILAETALLLIVIFLAMAIDRRETVQREMAEQQAALRHRDPAAPSDTETQEANRPTEEI